MSPREQLTADEQRIVTISEKVEQALADATKEHGKAAADDVLSGAMVSITSWACASGIEPRRVLQVFFESMRATSVAAQIQKRAREAS